MNINNENTKLSLTISWMRFPLIFMIVMLHCYCAINANGHPLFFKLVYPWGLWLGETGVPAFFFISGYLFFLSHKTYSQKLRSRVPSLLVPYLFWNAMILIAYIILYKLGGEILIAGKKISDYGIIDYIRAFIDRGDWNYGNGVPMLCPFWYIRNLMVLSLISPLIFYLLKFLRWLFVLVLLGWWISIPYNGMIVSSLLFFCMGAYFSIQQINPLTTIQKRKVAIFTVWIIFFVIDWAEHSLCFLSYGLIVHRISLVCNIFVLLLVGNYFRGNQSNVWLTMNKSSFWIYAVHYPLTIAIGKTSDHILGNLNDWQLLLFYFLCVIGVTTICVFSYAGLNKLCPQLMSIITGKRT